MMKPIWKAVFSSLVTKAGISTRRGMSFADSTFGVFAKREKRPRSDSRVCLRMKACNGATPRSSAWLKLMRFSVNGW